MKRSYLSIGAAVVTVAAAAAVATIAAAGERKLVEGIVVRVNDRILTVADMRKRVAERAAESGAPVAPEDYPQVVSEAADDLCVLERAVELKIEVSDEEVSESVKNLREQNKVPTDEQFEQMLKSLGMSVAQLRERMHDQMLINRALGKEMGQMAITDEELRQRYERDKQNFGVPEQVHLQHLVFPVGAASGDEERARADAQRLVAAARSGTDFATLIKQETDSGAASGGDLGTVAVPDLRSEVRDAVAGLKPGQVADPFVSAAGVQVVRLVERIPAGFKPFADVAEELRRREMDQRYRAKMHTVVDDLKKRYIVEVHPELFQP
jgi:parvulin-like peptidyl-prolyl isomerase